ncbi:MAG: hypothetical protein AC479_04365 [miscellaneous Crenarchaeota group-6 archaeon AD8-1]|nr:MAG: hypothetical protein AC479_04365 [miscellaneous Crenarchaeota group-6 archaeon AD8-1]
MFSSSFAWFYVFYNDFNNLIHSSIPEESIWYNIAVLLFLSFTVISAFLGSFIAERVNRRKFLLFWIIFGILVLLPVPFIQIEEIVPFFGILIGFSFGLGFPSCQAFIAESTTPEERGRVSGTVVLISFFLAMLFFLIIPSLGLGSLTVLIALIGLKLLTLVAFLLDPIDRTKGEPRPWRFVFGSKDFNYYVLAFIMFSIAASLVNIVWGTLYLDPRYIQVTQTAQAIRFVGIGIFAITAGLLADRIGRKKPIIIGLVMLGAAYTIVGLITTPKTYFFNLVVSGFAWGMLFTLFLVIPGDLAYSGSTERYYVTGWLLPITIFIGITGLGDFIGLDIPLTLYTTILTITLFATILPILSAAETLSESKIRQRRFKDYTEKVGKIVQEARK